MAFVRTKRIKGNDYHYLVEGIRDGDKVRQRVVIYLGEHATVESAYRFWVREFREQQDKQSKRYAQQMVKALERIGRKYDLLG